MSFESRAHDVGFELYLQGASTRGSRPIVQCPSDCTVLVPRGDYVLAVSPGADTRVGRRALRIDSPARLEVEPASESSRWAGITLLAVGIPLMGAGFGLAGGASQLDGGPSPPHPELFWAGFGGAALGVASIFGGAALIAGKPDVHASPPERRAAPTPNARYDAAAPGGKDETGRDPPPEAAAHYRAVERPNQALVTTGAIMLGASYGIGVAVAAAEAASDSSPRDSNLAIPLAGPFLAHGRDLQGMVLFLGLPEVIGAGLILFGAASTHRVWVRDFRDPGLSVRPLGGPGFGGIAVGGQL